MITFGNGGDVADAFEDMKRPLCEDTLVQIAELGEQLAKQGLSPELLVFAGKCRICSFVQNIIIPADAYDLDNLECANCGNMTMQEIEEDEEELEEWQL